MKLKSALLLTAAGLTLPFGLLQAGHKKNKVAVEESLVQKEAISIPDTTTLSNAFGHVIAKNLSDSPGLQLDIQTVIQGIKDEMDGKPSPLSEAQYEDAIAQIQKKWFDEMSEKNLSQANEFLTENAHKEQIHEIVQGKLQYSILKEGSGESVSENSTPLVHYTGRYLDDTVFGSSEQMEPIALELNDAIPGFKQGLMGAKKGEVRRLYVHPELGYGDKGFLLPNALMVFDIEVLENHIEQPKSNDPS